MANKLIRSGETIETKKGISTISDKNKAGKWKDC